MDADSVFSPPPAFRMQEVAGPADVLLLELAGEFDMATADQFRALVERARAQRRDRIVVDLSEVTFMDSTMLRELLRAHSEAAAAGAMLVVAGAQASVARLLELTGTSDLLHLAADRDAALAQVAR